MYRIVKRHQKLPANPQTTMPATELADLPNEVISNVVRRMDDLSCVCFGLTPRNNHRLVKDNKGEPLKAFCPKFAGHNMWVRVVGGSEHEGLIRLLWSRMGRRCVFCGVAEEDVEEYKQGKWRYERHVCRGWLNQENPQPSSTLPTKLYGAFSELKMALLLLKKEEFRVAISEFQKDIDASDTLELVQMLKEFQRRQKQRSDPGTIR